MPRFLPLIARTSIGGPVLNRHLWSAVAIAITTTLASSGCSGPAQLRPEITKAATSALALSDALEAMIENGSDTEEDRDLAYDLVKKLPTETAGDAFGRAAIAGRVAEKKGAIALFSTDKNPSSLVSEAEEFAQKSRALDPAFRDGAATRMLGTLYVLAPADMLKHGDSEDGLSMLEGLAKSKPDVLVNQLRLAEAYVALGDKEPAHEPLCTIQPKRATLRRDDQKLFDKLAAELKPLHCAPGAAPPAPAGSSAVPPATSPAPSSSAPSAPGPTP